MRKTTSVLELQERINGMLELPLQVETKQHICCILEEVLMAADCYCGFNYRETFDADNWNEEKDYNRFYYVDSRLRTQSNK